MRTSQVPQLPLNGQTQVGWGAWHHLLHQFGEIPLAESLDQAVQFVEVIPPFKSMEEVKFFVTLVKFKFFINSLFLWNIPETSEEKEELLEVNWSKPK